MFLDEPSTGLDAGARQALWQRIRALADHGACVLLTTHYLEEADQLSSRLIVLDHGTVIAEGTPAQLRDRVGADTLITATLEHRTSELHRQVERIAGVTHASSDGNQLRAFARHRDGLIAEVTTLLLPAGMRDLQISRPTLEHVTAELTAPGANPP